MRQPTLSVVLPNYNHSLFLPKALEDILSQSFCPLEILVIDDGSNDNSIEVIERFVKEHPVVRLIRNMENRGVIYSANRGVELAFGDYIYFAAADDLILPGLFEKSMSLLARYPDAGLSSAIVESERDGTRILFSLEDISLKDCFLSPADCIRLLRRRSSWMGGNSTIFRRGALIEAGGFLPELGPLCDVFVEMVIAMKHGVCYIPTLLSVQRLYTSSYSAIMMSNLDTNLRLYSQAANLMRTTYKELFPPDFINAWEERELHLTRLIALKQLQQQEIAVVRGFFTRQTVADRLIISGLALAMRVQLLAFISYLFLRLGKELRHVVTKRVKIAIRRIQRKVSTVNFENTKRL